jgi:hypothetical protein
MHVCNIHFHKQSYYPIWPQVSLYRRLWSDLLSTIISHFTHNPSVGNSSPFRNCRVECIVVKLVDSTDAIKLNASVQSALTYLIRWWVMWEGRAQPESEGRIRLRSKFRLATSISFTEQPRGLLSFLGQVRKWAPSHRRDASQLFQRGVGEAGLRRHGFRRWGHKILKIPSWPAHCGDRCEATEENVDKKFALNCHPKYTWGMRIYSAPLS